MKVAMKARTVGYFLILGFLGGFVNKSPAAENPLKEVPAAQYELFYRDQNEKPGKKISIPALLVQQHPISNNDFLEFVNKNNQYRRSEIPRILATENYLIHWTGDLQFDKKISDQPVVNVSWFAATAYCESLGLQLLTVNEWEYASAIGKQDFKSILEWYQKPNDDLGPVDKGNKNKFGLINMHGLIWEWVQDFSSIIIKADSRGTNDRERGLFCGAGSLGTANPELYANFMRFAFRSSLKANYVSSNLGFRCGRVKNMER